MTVSTAESAKLAVDGGPKAFEGRTGVAQPKVGVEEFMSIAERFGFTPEARERIRGAISNDDLEGGGPHLGRYYGNPKPIKGEQFEELAREIFGVKYAMAASSGTGALHAAFIAVGAGPGKEVICPGAGFLATSMAAAITGATPVFCDIDDSLQMDPAGIEALITPATVALAPTHHAGNVCDMDPIMAVARKHGVKVIEDCAQAPGATYKGRYVGSIGDIGCFSISCYKIIGGGEGGMMVTGDERLYERGLQLAEGGGLWRPDRFAPERYEGELFPGTNYRLSELESAVNVVQLGKLGGVVGRFRQASQSIKAQLGEFEEISWQRSNDPEGDIGYSLRFSPATPGLAAKIVEALRAEGVGGGHRGPGGRPDWHLYSEMFPLFGQYGDRCRPECCPLAVETFHREIRIGIDQWLAPADCDAIAAGINKVLTAYCTPKS